MALTRLCVFCFEPQAECICPDVDEPARAVTENLTASHFAWDEPEPRDALPPYRGAIVIEWPPPGPSPYSAMVGFQLCIFDAVSGKQIKTATHIEVHAPADGAVTADLTLLANEDGEPLFEGEPVLDGGEIRTGVFPFVVSEMRVKPRLGVTPKGGSRF